MPALSGTARSRATAFGSPRAIGGSFAGKTEVVITTAGEQIRDGVSTDPYIRDGISATIVRDGVLTDPIIRDGVSV